MADDISSILGDGQTMEQLGSSLLQKQATDRAATQKADKKSRRVGQALADPVTFLLPWASRSNNI